MSYLLSLFSDTKNIIIAVILALCLTLIIAIAYKSFTILKLERDNMKITSENSVLKNNLATQNFAIDRLQEDATNNVKQAQARQKAADKRYLSELSKNEKLTKLDSQADCETARKWAIEQAKDISNE